MKNQGKVGRNDPCPCGSGKKFKHCCVGKKTRKICLSANLTEPTRLDGLKLYNDGRVELIREGGAVCEAEVEVSYQYDRDSGKPKIINRQFGSFGNINLDLNSKLAGFGMLVGIDTNTKEVNEQTISVGAIVMGTFADRRGNEVQLDLSLSCFFEYRGLPKDLAEKYIWRVVIQSISEDESYRRTAPIGVVVDAHLGQIADINRRSTPVIDDWMLPEGFELIYATADSGKGFVPNRMIKDCDKFASMQLDHILSLESKDFPAELSEDPYGNEFRQWIS